MEILNFLFDVVVKIFTYQPNISGLMVADPVTAAAIIGATGALGSSVIGSNASNKASQQQANATAQGARDQGVFANEMFNYDNQRNYDAGQWLKTMLPNFDMTKIYAPDSSKYFSDEATNKYYDTAKGNLNQSMLSGVNTAQQSAGASAASRGLANPSAFTAMVGNQASQQWLPQFGQLEQGRAGALLGNQEKRYNADFQGAQFNSQQNQILNSLRQLGYGNQSQFAQQYGNPNDPFKGFYSSLYYSAPGVGR